MHYDDVEGYCDDLRMLSRQEFVRDIFNTMEVQHNGPGNRVPTGFVGSKKSSSNQIADVKISLIRSQVSSVQELMTYQKDSGLDVMDASFVAIKMSCPSHGCSYCVRFQPTPSIQVQFQFFLNFNQFNLYLNSIQLNLK